MPQAPPERSREREPDTSRSSSGAEASSTSSDSPKASSSSTFTISPVGATAAGVAVAAAACALAAGGHWRATASALAEDGIDAVTRRKAVPTAVSFLFVVSLVPGTCFGFSLSFSETELTLAHSLSHPLSLSTSQQARALGVATAACGVAVALVGGAASAAGLLPQLAGKASVATPAAAAEATERARAAVRGSMRAMILGEEGEGGGGEEGRKK